MAHRRPKGRPVNGILLLDKSIGLTSNAALQQVKRLFNANKVGHTGSLDPLASGLLPLCFGEATKMSGFLLDANKAYEGKCRLGVRTTTADAEGDVIEEHPVPTLTAQQITQELAKFLGEIEQIPPMHSAIKYKGTPLYKLAHQGIEIERQPRKVHVYELGLLGDVQQDEFSFYLRCSKGTYVRTLAEDMGKAIGCGAYLSGLRRTLVGPFVIENAVTLEELTQRAQESSAALDSLLLPVEAALAQWPAIHLTESSAFYVRQGQPVQVAKAPTTGWVRLFVQNDCFLGVGEILDDGRVAPRRLVDIRA